MKRKTFKYRLYPNKSQAKKLNAGINACRFVWNIFLGERKNLYETEKKSISKFDQMNRLPEMKKEFPFLKDAYSQSLQHIGTTLDLAFRAFFQRIKKGEAPGYPRFKGVNRFHLSILLNMDVVVKSLMENWQYRKLVILE